MERRISYIRTYGTTAFQVICTYPYSVVDDCTITKGGPVNLDLLGFFVVPLFVIDMDTQTDEAVSEAAHKKVVFVLIASRVALGF